MVKEEIVVEYLDNQKEVIIYPFDSNTNEISQTMEVITKTELELLDYKIMGEIRNGERIMFEESIGNEFDDDYIEVDYTDEETD